MTAPAHAPACPLCGAPADLSGLAPVVSAVDAVPGTGMASPAATSSATPTRARPGRDGAAEAALPRCERVERALERRAEARHAATAAAIEGLITGGDR
jgi:hypothetical protein